jgi:hypothetical protein
MSHADLPGRQNAITTKMVRRKDFAAFLSFRQIFWQFPVLLLSHAVAISASILILICKFDCKKSLLADEVPHPSSTAATVK